MCTQAEMCGVCSGDLWFVFQGSLGLFQKVGNTCCVCYVPEVRFRDFFLFQETNHDICFLIPICFQQAKKNLFVVTICGC